MKNIAIKLLIALPIAIIAFSTLTAKTEAKEQCFTQYGGGETCVDVDENAKLKVDKVIWNPKGDLWENHIDPKSGSNPYKFSADEEIVFRIKVKNVGDVKIEEIKLVDILPDFVEYNDGDGDENGDKVEFDEFDLEPGESEEFEFTAKVSDEDVLPNDDYVCVTNIAKAEGTRVDDDEDEESASDYANFCIELDGEKEDISELPTTGANNPIVIIALSIGLLLIGFGFKEIANAK